ncbi:hypothetical protein [Segnochrobactrum spirostomi]|uniref:hypothetical protein n=1 Tax=Segnochrobactrum spirostomi TaxID=2608987 RepID=UPI0035E3F7BA
MGRDHERRHQIVEEAVIVIGCEDNDQLRIEFLDLGAGRGKHGVDLGRDLRRRIVEPTQRRVREALEFD